MSEPSTVIDPADPRLADYTDLTDVELRRRREPAEGLFIAEGEKVIRRAVAAGYRMRSMLLTAKWLDVMADVIAETDAPVHVVEPALAEAVTGYHVHRGALASMERQPLPAVADILPGAGSPDSAPSRVVVLEGIVDHANLGAVYRSAAALGMDAVLLSPDCADPLYRRAVKVSMGAVFTVPYARLEPWPGSLAALREAGYTILALTPAPDAVPLDEVPAATLRRCAVMLGSEGNGLTAKALEAADLKVRIPMSHDIDSLNIAAAAAISFYAVAHHS
ncbi:RNA methyltransferase [Kitasatospora sp. MAP5-34]|uniref:TrmH family RNA methyltransferase n=1 Tax=Kitasatospora sp. MAP5-34 TaxID=3035102 RepID=UPI0024757BAA|nr:RNA methyltransferase [Kitasatospora sp. MAP5-34]MDH6575862.1 tRNA G18 (ribose-2'-O)-methylase SpoU [Kitasatospora sp. MAP5-34]